MKAKKREARKTTPEIPVAARRVWPWAAAVFAAVVAVFQVYAPVLHGPFLFDDDYLPFRVPGFSAQLRDWLAGSRPLLMLTYWMNFRLSAEETFGYHALNLLFHLGAGLMVFVIVRRLAAAVGTEPGLARLLGIFGAGVFLLHPVQTESVAYVASRSENLSVFLMLASLAVFVTRSAPAISWGRAAAVLALFAGAAASKEHTVVLPLVLLMADYWFNPGFRFEGIRRNWRLYAPMAVLAAAAGALVVRPLLFSATTAGFGVSGIRWYEYFFTQCRALFLYLRMVVLPYGQTVDHDFALSRTLWEHGAVIGLVALAAISVAAWVYRRRWPLASFGWFAFLVLMAPTSSIMPIRDPVAERRLYISMAALVLIAADFLRRVRLDRKALAGAVAAALVVCAALSYNRNQVWSDRVALWEDAVRKTPQKARPHFQLAYAYYEQGRCDAAVPHYETVARLEGAKYDLLVDWALAYDCLGRADQAVEKLQQAASQEKTAHAWALMGMVYGKQGRWNEALAALETAEKIDPSFAMTYVYRGGVRLAQNAAVAAAAEYRRALALDPANQLAREGLAQAERRMPRM